MNRKSTDIRLDFCFNSDDFPALGMHGGETSINSFDQKIQCSDQIYIAIYIFF